MSENLFEPAEPLPPRREQLPLPRRDEQSHIEPQLRVPGSSGAGTPFAPFGGSGGVNPFLEADEQPTQQNQVPPPPLPPPGARTGRPGPGHREAVPPPRAPANGHPGLPPGPPPPEQHRRTAVSRAAAFRAAALRAFRRATRRSVPASPPDASGPPTIPGRVPDRRYREQSQFDVWGDDSWAAPAGATGSPYGTANIRNGRGGISPRNGYPRA